MEADYIIIGAGSAGSVLANRLSTNHSVVLIEAGPKDHHWDFRLHMPAALSMVLSNDRYNWFYQSEPEPGLSQRNIYCPRGRVLGGSSSINGMVYVRGNEQDFDAWARNPGLEGWHYGHCLPYFKRAETASHGDPSERGKHGPLHVGRGNAENPLARAWIEAGIQAGYRKSNDFNGQYQEGFGIFDNTIKSGKRFSTAQAYLRPIMARSNLSIIKKALVTRIILKDNLATGVEYQSKGQLHTIGANCEVILSAGAINSPQILMLSGIGNGSLLSKYDIPVVSDLPGVGNNLQDHLEIYIQYQCSKPVSLYPALRWFNQPAIGLKWYLTRKGPGSSNHFEAGAFLKSSDSVAYPDLQCHFLPVAMDYDGKQKYNGHGFQAHVGPMKPTSRGSVQIQSSDPRVSPKILFNYNTTEQDRSVMRRGIQLVREIVSQRAFDEFRGEEIRPGFNCNSNRQLDKFISQNAESAYHPSCTCRMGTDPLSVVDGQARVHGIDGLRVIDASIMPEITNGNLNAPVIMMAEKLSDEILGIEGE